MCRYCASELYKANVEGKTLYPVIFEDTDLNANERCRNVRYCVTGCNLTMFRPGKDDYHASFEKLVKGLSSKSEL